MALGRDYLVGVDLLHAFSHLYTHMQCGHSSSLQFGIYKVQVTIT